jgi:periplasmic divalent cation tolerance protein
MEQDKGESIFIGWTTVSNEEDALQLINKLLSTGLIACAQLSQPIDSFYIWKGEIKKESEIRITLKFSLTKETEVAKELFKLHPYNTPQWVYCEMKADAEYANWVDEAKAYAQ